MPHFLGDDELHQGLKRLAGAIENDGKVSKAVPVPKWVTRLTLLGFWMHAIEERTAPFYTEVGQASDHRSESLSVDLVATAAEEAPHEYRQAAEERLVKLIARAERRWTTALVKRAAAAASQKVASMQKETVWEQRLADVSEADGAPTAPHMAEPNGDESIPAELLRLYDAAEVLLGPHWVRCRIKEHARRTGRSIAAAELRACLPRR